MSRSPSKRLQEKNSISEKAPIKVPCDKRIVYLNDKLLSSDDLQIIELSHPRNGTQAPFICDKTKKEVYEVTVYDEGYRSWFINNSVMSDGKIYLTTKIDVTYLVLPYLMKSKQNIPLDHLLEDKDFPSTWELAEFCEDLSHIATRKGNAELKVWCYDESSTMKWLEKRTKQLAKKLQQKQVPLTISSQYHKSFGEEEEKLAYISLAHGIIAEYLSEELEESLKRHLKIPDATPKHKATEPAENTPKSKKPKVEEPVDDYSTNKKITPKAQPTKTSKEKALAKSASGSKNIMSFFGKK